MDENFDQAIINKIVLWKVNRFAEIPEDTLVKINKIEKSERQQLDEILTLEIISELLKSDNKGFGLPMISSILRFKNPYNYQIIDQRVYRFVYGEELILRNTNSPKEVKREAALYLDYLKKLREECLVHKIPFEFSDRILYVADKVKNKNVPLKNYGRTIIK